MRNITNYETKEVECDRCGWVGTIAKHIPLKKAWCGGCRSSRIRLHKRLLTKDAADLPYVSGFEADFLEIDGKPIMITVKPSSSG